MSLSIRERMFGGYAAQDGLRDRVEAMLGIAESDDPRVGNEPLLGALDSDGSG